MSDTRPRTLRRATAVATVFTTICLIAAAALLSAHGEAVNLRSYNSLWAKYEVPKATGMSMDDLNRAGRALAGYLDGSLASPQVEVTVSGEKRPLFNALEITHLEDVKSLFRAGLTAEWISIASAFVGTMILKSTGGRKAAAKTYLTAGAVSLAALLILAIPAAADFTGWWTNFHLLTFTNDSWRLDPSTDWLIRMFPEEFFFSMVKRIGLRAGITSIALLGVGFLGAKPAKRPKRT